MPEMSSKMKRYQSGNFSATNVKIAGSTKDRFSDKSCLPRPANFLTTSVSAIHYSKKQPAELPSWAIRYKKKG